MIKFNEKNKNLKKIFDVICDKLPESIFKTLGFNFFRNLVLKKIIYVYSINVDNKLASVITVINYKNYDLINRFVIKHLLIKPHKILLNFFKLFKSLSKTSKLYIRPNYLHLLHLIIFKDKFNKYTISKKDKIINSFYKKILRKHNANTLFLCFDKSNIGALKYYSRNSFKPFHDIGSIIYYKKKYKI